MTYKNPNPKGTQSKRTLRIEELLLAGVPPVDIYQQMGIGRGVVAGVAFRMRERGINVPKVVMRWPPERLAEYFSTPIEEKKLDNAQRKLIAQFLIENNNSLAIRKKLAEKYNLTASQINTIAYQVKAVEKNKTNPAMNITNQPGKPIAAGVTLPSKVGRIMKTMFGNDDEGITSLLNLKNNQCRYPIGRKNDTHMFCGSIVQASSSYCEYHHKIVWIPPKRR
jgi:hypothetical protein